MIVASEKGQVIFTFRYKKTLLFIQRLVLAVMSNQDVDQSEAV